MLSIPPEKYALLEKNLKRYVKWDVNLFRPEIAVYAWDEFCQLFEDTPSISVIGT